MTRHSWFQLIIGVPVQLVCIAIFLNTNHNNIWFGVLSGIIGGSAGGIVEGILAATERPHRGN